MIKVIITINVINMILMQNNFGSVGTFGGLRLLPSPHTKKLATLMDVTKSPTNVSLKEMGFKLINTKTLRASSHK